MEIDYIPPPSFNQSESSSSSSGNQKWVAKFCMLRREKWIGWRESVTHLQSVLISLPDGCIPSLSNDNHHQAIMNLCTSLCSMYNVEDAEFIRFCYDSTNPEATCRERRICESHHTRQMGHYNNVVTFHPIIKDEGKQKQDPLLKLTKGQIHRGHKDTRSAKMAEQMHKANEDTHYQYQVIIEPVLEPPMNVVDILDEDGLFNK